MARLVDYVKQHVLGAMLTAMIGSGSIGAAAGSAVTYYFAVQEARVARFETSMLSEYQAVAAAKRELYSSIDKMTLALADGTRPDAQLISNLNQQLLELHQRVDVFSIGLNDKDRAKITNVKIALAEMKAEIARAKTKKDLPYLAGKVALFEEAYKSVTPIVERKIGLPNDMLSG